MSAIAIDFGSSNTVLAYWNAVTNQPETLKLDAISRPYPYGFLIPSLLYLRDPRRDRVAIGQQVINSGMVSQDQRYFNQIKRQLSFSAGFTPEIDSVKVTPEYIGELFLSQVFEHVRSQQILPSEIIFTVPVQSYERYLHWLESCSQRLLEHSPTARIRTLDEPTAAALGYAVNQPGSLVLVIDFGGGTLDLSLVRTPRAPNPTSWGDYIGESGKPDTKVEVIAKTGQVIGGEDVDRWLVEDFIDRHSDSSDLSIAKGNILLSLMERIKISLSDRATASEVFFDLNQLEGFDITYSRQQLEAVLQRRGFYRVLQTSIDEIVNRAASKGVLKMDIKDVILVGGSTQIPSVRDLISNYFSRANIHTKKPFEAVSHGALMLNQGVRVRDYLFHSYAIRYWQAQLEQWQYQPLFLRGQVYPTRHPMEVILRASQPHQKQIELLIGELEKRAAGSAEVIFDGDRLVTQINHEVAETFMPLIDSDTPQAIAELKPLGQPGIDRLKVLFNIDASRQLIVTAIDLETGRHLIVDRPVAELR